MIKLYVVTIDDDGDLHKLMTVTRTEESIRDIPDGVYHDIARMTFNKLDLPQPIGGFELDEIGSHDIDMHGGWAIVRITDYLEELL